MNERKEQNMTAHPYPQHVMESVATAIFDHYNASDGLDITAVDTAEVALSALWEASRVDTIEQLDALPNDAVLIDVNGVAADDYVTHCILDLPARVLHWGDSRG